MVHWKGALCSGMASNTDVIQHVLHWVVFLQGSCSPLFLPFHLENITGWLSQAVLIAWVEYCSTSNWYVLTMSKVDAWTEDWQRNQQLLAYIYSNRIDAQSTC